MDLENINDKIKFLIEIAKIISNIDNKMEQEVYIDKISNEYNITKEAIYSQINKLMYSNSQGQKTLEIKRNNLKDINKKMLDKNVSENDIKREKMLIWLLINDPKKTYNEVKNIIEIDDIKVEKNKNVIKKLYEEFEKGNININNLLNLFEQSEVDYITGIMSENLEITDINKGIKDIVLNFQKDKLLEKKSLILNKIGSGNISSEDSKKLESELIDVINKISKLK